MTGTTGELSGDPAQLSEIRKDLARAGLLRSVRGYGTGKVWQTDFRTAYATGEWLKTILSEPETETVRFRLRGLPHAIRDEACAERLQQRLRLLGLLRRVEGNTKATIWELDRDKARALAEALTNLGEQE